MNKIIILLGLILIFTQPVFATDLQGGVSFDVDSARAYVQDGQINDIGQQSNLYYNGDSMNADIIYGYNTNGVPEAFTVRYKDDMKKAYIYGMDNKLLYVDKFDKPSDLFPHRGYRYNTKGKLIGTSLTVSKGNRFAFTPKGKLVVRVVDGTGYLGNTNIVVGHQSNY